MLISRRFLNLILIAASVILLTGCATTGPGGKKSLIIISDAQEVSIGQSLDQQVRETETILPDTAWQNYINELGNRIVAVSDRRDLQFHFAVVESDQVNAFAAPGGYVYFYTGLIRELDNESELAAVMAHEISHVVARHGVKQLQTVMGVSLLLDLALGKKSETTQKLAGTAAGILMQGYSRDHEREADRFGMIYAARAGWDPGGFVMMFQKLKDLQGGDHEMSFFEMLAASHPPLDERIQNANAMTPKILAEYSNSLRKDSPRFHQLQKRLPPPKKS